MQKPSLVLPIVVAALALVGLVSINTFAQKNRPKSSAELIEEERAQAAAEEAKKGTPAPPQVDPATGNVSSGAPSSSEINPALLGPEFSLPSRAAGENAPEVSIGYEWTPDLQGDPERLAKLARQLQELVPQAKLRFVNTDANPDAKPGIVVNNQVVVPPDADGNINDASLKSVADAVGSAKTK
jgi:hypothetical protein